jgi:hypothetical protein
MVLTSQEGSEPNLMNNDVRGSGEMHRAGRRHDLAKNEETGLPTRKRSLIGNPARFGSPTGCVLKAGDAGASAEDFEESQDRGAAHSERQHLER